MNSTFHLVDSIAMVGGLTPTGSYRKVKVTGADGTERYFDISKYYTNADFSVNPNINPNDVIQILQADILVYASNALLYPGTYELIEGETIDAVIQQSGGFAGDENFIKASVLRKSGSTTETILVEAEFFSEFKLQDKDIINFIPESLQYDPVIIDGAINIGSASISSQIAAQAGHAVLGAIFTRLYQLEEFTWNIENENIVFKGDPILEEWFNESYTKICLYVNSEEELLELKNKADKLGIVAKLVKDNGTTEFNGVPTYTCLAFEPLPSEKIDILTGNLPLY